MPALDQLLLAAFLAATLLLGLRRGGRGEGVDYLLAGRRLTLAPFVATMVSTWYGGVLAIGEYSWGYGLSSWLVFGVPYYVAAGIFAWLLAARSREAEIATIPEQLSRAYGPLAGHLGTAMVFTGTLPAAYLLTLGVLLQLAFGLPQALGLVLAAGFSVVYLWRAGFASVTRTDAFQFLLMFGGFALLLGFLAVGWGTTDFLRAHTPETHWVWHGGNTPQFIAVWYVIALSTLVEPTFYQRCFAAQTPEVARRGLLVSIGCWAIFDFMTTTCGLYSRALLTDLPPELAVEAFPRLAQRVLPTGFLGLFFMGLFATVMSTVDSQLFVAASTLGRDVLGRVPRFRGPDGERRATRLGLLVAGAATLGMALASDSVVAIWHALGTLGTCTLLVPTVGAFVPALRMSPRGAVAAMALAGPLSAWWLAQKHLAEAYPLGLEPIFPGLAVALGVWGVDRWTSTSGQPAASPEG